MIAQEQFDQLTTQVLTNQNLCARILGALESHNPTYVRELHKVFVTPDQSCVCDSLIRRPCE